jgi:uncharacterized protein (DUF608 family)
LECIYGKVKEKNTEVKRHNGWNRERDVKESYENFIHNIKGKVEDTTSKKERENGG